MSKTPPPAPPAPFQDEVARVTNIIMEQIGKSDVESALTVVCNLAGQFVASITDGRPSEIQKYTDSLADNIRRVAITKILYDDAKARREKTWH